MSGFTVTYAIVTPESANRGDYAEHGFAMPGGWRYPINEAMAMPDESLSMDLRAAREIVWPIEDCGNWFAGEAHTLSYRDGSDITYNLHPPKNVTPSSYARLHRLFAIRY